MTGPFSVLLVCEGNLCRSPWAEVVFRRRWSAHSSAPLVVSSAGTHSARGASTHPLLAEVVPSQADRAALGAHRSRRVDPQLLRAQDLVLVMEHRHRADLLHVAPSVLRKVFTIAEVDRLVRSRPISREERLLPLVEVLAQRRRPGGSALEEDVADPARGTVDDFRSMAWRIEQMVGNIVPFLAAGAAAGSTTDTDRDNRKDDR